MPVLDLITPWATGSTKFTNESARLIESLRRQRAPTEIALPPPVTFDGLVGRARDPSLHHRLRDTRDLLVERGLRRPKRLVLVASAAPGDASEPLPAGGGDTAVALFLDRADDDALQLALASAMGVLTRWEDVASPVSPLSARGDWDRWEAAREIPLMEWFYAAGIGVHARALVAPTAEPHELLSITRGAFRRLRHDERALAGRLAEDLARKGVGVVMRWLDDHAPPALRSLPGDELVPPGAGRYLAWRELRDRVDRVGVAEACRMVAG